MSELTNQTRSMPAKFETREDADGNKIIEGYFAVFNSQTELWPGAFEQIAPGAFDSTIGNDIRALTNHDTTLVLGRAKAGTLKLSTDQRGLFGEIRINPADSDAVNLYERVKRGDVDQCSFGFNVNAEDTEWRDDGTVSWTLTDIDLIEVSVVTFPAYEDTGVAARKKDITAHAQKRSEQWKHNILEKLNGGNK